MKAGIYARVSKEDQNEENQIFKLKDYAKVREFTIIKVYKDHGLTGRKMARPGLQDLLNDIKSGKIDTVLIWKLDRISRSVLDLINLVMFFKDHNTNFISYQDNIDLNSSMGKYVFHTFAALAELESDLISERTKLAYERKAAYAKNLGHKPIWGRPGCVIKPFELRRIKDLRNAIPRESWRSIATLLNMDREEKKKLSYSTIRRAYALFNKGG